MVYMKDIALLGDGHFSVMELRPIYTLSSGPHITRFSPVVAMKRKNFEQNFVLIQANTAYRQQISSTKLLHKYVLLNIFKSLSYSDLTVANNQIYYQ